ncbi:MAG: EscU/YscU/HrcU family type III secretion system export apparatus switch protein [Pontiellaceae bacterium]|nr:EscU/YscU/HrcU family type III secretion system export apparatus switch protein [Pontiellaceae bacterium]MBN2784097.1 EscU/YscU/HrcU family type III secretion system export apparatus switch protein [Pontiellaceae bacterium]
MGLLHPEEGTDGKTERGTQRKRKEARKEGKVVISNEIITIVVLAGGMLVLMGMLPLMKYYLTGFMYQWTEIDVTGSWSIEMVQGLIRQSAMMCVLGILPFGIVAVLGSTVASMAQTQPFFQPEVMKLNFNALNPVNGAKQLFSMESIVKLVLSMLKVAVISLVVWSVVRKQLNELAFLNRLDISEGIQWFMTLLIRICIRVLSLFMLIAVLDWIKEKRKFEKSIMMTKQEVKEEHKSQQSSPQVKQKMRNKMRQLSTARMMAAVPDATVVVTNPTFIAIAIKYDPASGGAPIVVAKGKRLTAKRIRAIAEENGVAIVERKPLARAMYNKVEIGKPVPATYYQAIAELLAYLYRMGNARIRQQMAMRR